MRETLRITQGIFQGHHPPKGDAHDHAPLPPEGIDQFDHDLGRCSRIGNDQIERPEAVVRLVVVDDHQGGWHSLTAGRQVEIVEDVPREMVLRVLREMGGT